MDQIYFCHCTRVMCVWLKWCMRSGAWTLLIPSPLHFCFNSFQKVHLSIFPKNDSFWFLQIFYNDFFYFLRLRIFFFYVFWPCSSIFSFSENCYTRIRIPRLFQTNQNYLCNFSSFSRFSKNWQPWWVFDLQLRGTDHLLRIQQTAVPI